MLFSGSMPLWWVIASERGRWAIAHLSLHLPSWALVHLLIIIKLTFDPYLRGRFWHLIFPHRFPIIPKVPSLLSCSTFCLQYPTFFPFASLHSLSSLAVTVVHPSFSWIPGCLHFWWSYLVSHQPRIMALF